MGQLVVGELRVAQRQPHAAQRVVAEPSGLLPRGAGRGERVPGTRRGVSFLVLHGIQQMRQASEEAARLGQRLRVLRLAREYRGVGEGRRGGGLGGFGDRGQRGAGPGEQLDAGLPVDGVDEQRRVEAELCAGARAGPVPARGNPACCGGDRAALQQAVPVGDVVPHLRRCQHQGDGGGQPGSLAAGDRGGPHGAQRARPGGTPPSGGALGLSLRQNRDDQTVIVRDDPGELPMVGTECEAEPAEVGHPLGPEPLGQPMGTGPDDSEHDDPPRVAHLCAALVRMRDVHRIEGSVHPYVPHVTHTERRIIFSFFQAPDAGGTLTNRHIFCTSTVTNPLRADYPLGARSASWTTIGIRKRCGTPRNRGERRRPWDRCARRVPGWAS